MRSTPAYPSCGRGRNRSILADPSSFFDIVETVLYSGIVLYLGLVLGSFSTALIYRIPNGLSWIYDRQLGSPRSACPSCRTLLGIRDLVPIVSWVLLKGRCRYCRTPIGGIYPLAEAVCLAGCIGIFIAQNLNVSSALTMLAVPFLVAFGAIDIRHGKSAGSLIPVLAILGGTRALWVAFEAKSMAPTWDCLAGGVLFLTFAWGLWALLRVVPGYRAMTWDSVKVFGVAGVWLGVSAFLPFLAAVIGAGGLMLCLCKLIKRDGRFPQGAVLALALYAVLTLNAGP